MHRALDLADLAVFTVPPERLSWLPAVPKNASSAQVRGPNLFHGVDVSVIEVVAAAERRYSKRWANPVLPGFSFFEPTSYTCQQATMGLCDPHARERWNPLLRTNLVYWMSGMGMSTAATGGGVLWAGVGLWGWLRPCRGRDRAADPRREEGKNNHHQGCQFCLKTASTPLRSSLGRAVRTSLSGSTPSSPPQRLASLGFREVLH